MLQIRVRPETQEIMADDGNCLYGFDGTPYRRPAEAAEWKQIAEAPSVAAWQTNPGDYRTYNGAFSVIMIFNADGEKHTFTMGDTIAYLLGWLYSAREVAAVSIQWIGAYNDRNIARAYNLSGVHVEKPAKRS